MIQWLRILEEYPFQLVFAGLLFTKDIRRRKWFLGRLILAAVPMIMIYDQGIYLMEPLSNEFLDRAILAIPVLYMILCIRWCNECNWNDALFYATASAITQNLIYNIYWIIKTHFGINEGSGLSVAVSVPITLIISFFVLILFVERMKQWGGVQFHKIRLLASAVAVVILNIFCTPRMPENSPEQYRIYIAYILTDILALMLQFGLFNESGLEQKNRIIGQLLYEEQKKQKMTSENIDIINRKCHDLKHQISLLRSMGAEKERDVYIREIEDAVMIYNSAVHTGSETLDLILMDKQLYCGKHCITLNCIADGERLAFMDTMDIYSIFGNALDNAIESVMQNPEEKKRIITLRVGGRGNLTNIHLENYTDKIPEFSDGLPKTTKSDKRYHGFGMLSIRHIVQKYQGTMNVKMKGHIFCLDIIFLTDNRI